MMNLRSLLLLSIALATLSGCGLIYKQNIQQGNALEQDDLDELYLGMNQRQVLFVLGTPSIKDPFHPERWDYVQTFSRRGGDLVQRTVTLRFDNDVLAEIIGQESPFASSAEEGGSASGQVASFVKKPQKAPQDASLESAEEEILEGVPDIDKAPERSADDREYERDKDVLDQTPSDGPMGPDIDG